jgi:hypothetical protein
VLQHGTYATQLNFRIFDKTRQTADNIKPMHNLEDFCLLEYNAAQSVEKLTDVSEKHVASRLSPLLLVSCLAYSPNLKMEATCSSETSVDFQRTTRHYIPEERTHNHRCENLKSYIILKLPHKNRLPNFMASYNSLA